MRSRLAYSLRKADIRFGGVQTSDRIRRPCKPGVERDPARFGEACWNDPGTIFPSLFVSRGCSMSFQAEFIDLMVSTTGAKREGEYVDRKVLQFFNDPVFRRD